MLLGINMPSAAFGQVPRGVYGQDYIYPSDESIDYYAAKDMGVIRLSFHWESVQPDRDGPLDPVELSRIDHVVDYAASRGMKVILDVVGHGMANFDGKTSMIGSADLPNSSFGDLWGKLSEHFKGDANVMYGLMNEPYQHTAAQWLQASNTAIKAIRDAGADQHILVPGTYWDGGHTWVSSDNDTVIGAGVVDPLRNFSFEIHQYMDADASGKDPQALSTTIGAERLTAVTEWARSTGNKLFLGEFGAGTDTTSLAALDNMLAYVGQNTDVYTGAAYWAGGPWWGSYPLTVEPDNLSSPIDKPQMEVLEKYLGSPSQSSSTYVGTGPDVLTLRVSEDAYQGHAEYRILVDGQSVGGTLTARASHAAGQTDTVVVRGDWGPGDHSVELNFLNDAYDGTPATDRNLYLADAAYNGSAVRDSVTALLTAGTTSFHFNETLDTALGSL